MFLSTSSINYSTLRKRLEDNCAVTKEYFKDLQKIANKEKKYISELLLEDTSLSQEKILKELGDCYNLPWVNLEKKIIMPNVVRLIPKEVAEQHSVVVFKKIGNIIRVATTRPEDTQTIEFIKQKTGFEIEVFLTTPKGIRHAFDKYNSNISDDFEKMIEQSLQEAKSANIPLEKIAQFVPIIKMVDRFINQAANMNASDIHIEPTANQVKIRFRIDGLLHTTVQMPKSILSPVIARIKILARLKIDEHRIPQDGRFQFVSGDKHIPIRVSIIPTLHGPKVAMRLLEMNQSNFTLGRLGLNKKDQKLLKEKIKTAHGMILVTGPTGSGKTTSLYTALRMVNSDYVNICTIEDPIEYDIEGVNQMQINPQVGLTFASGLRSLLRQDPNIIMVGEIRDKDTADIAVNSAMTGHLVLSTLHTNNAFLTVQRLAEMGIPSYLFSPVINLVIGQRLVRKICKDCRSRYRDNNKFVYDYQNTIDIRKIFAKLQEQKLIDPQVKFEELHLYKNIGCKKCNNTGFKGRTGIYEILDIDDELRKIILKDSSEQTIKQEAIRRGVLTLIEDGFLRVFLGITTIEEVLRVTKE